MTTDDRLGLPSASGIEALSLCLGKHAAERGLPPLPESEDAASGTRIHEVLAGNGTVMLADDEADVVNRCEALAHKAYESIFGTSDVEVDAEKRLWIFDRFSGKADVIAYSKQDLYRVAAILDFKTGRNEVTTAGGNAQLRALAVLLDLSMCFRLERIVVGIIQPWASEPISLCEYTREDLAKAREWLLGVLDAADKPDAPRIPGEKQCRFCKAAYYGTCTEAQNAAYTPSVMLQVRSDAPSPQEVVLKAPSESLARFYDTAKFARSMYEKAEDEIKRRLKAGDEEMAKYYALKEGATKEVIKDLETVHQRFISYGGTTAQYLACLSAAKGKLQDAMKEATGYKGKELKAAFEALIQDCVEVKQNEPSLERVKQ